MIMESQDLVIDFQPKSQTIKGVDDVTSQIGQWFSIIMTPTYLSLRLFGYMAQNCAADSAMHAWYSGLVV